MDNDILLTITMLVSDREDTIEKCMKSLKHLLDTVASELIVVDTAGNSVCMEIVRQYTDKIVKFKWCNDFAAARNAGASKARGQWLMFLDDDEWFESTEELEKFFLSGDYQTYNAATYIVRNYFDKEGTKWSDFVASRLVKREKKTCFYGKIHEYLTPVRHPICYLNDYVHHYGYVFESRQKQIEHSWRNIRPLLELRKEKPEDFHPAAQLIQEYVGAEEYFSAIELAKELRKTHGCWSVSNTRYTTYAVVTEVKLYIRQQRYGDGYEVGKKILNNTEISILARGCLCNQMVGICFRLEKYKEAIAYMDKFEASLKIWEDYPEKKLLDLFSCSSVYMMPEELGRFAMLKLHIHVLQEEWEEAGEMLLSIEWQDENLRMLVNTADDVIAILKKTDFKQEYIKALQALENNLPLRETMYGLVDKEETEDKEKLIHYFALLPLDDAKLCKYHLIYASSQNNKSVAVLALEKMKEENYPFFLEDALYWDSLFKLNITINDYINGLSLYDWMEMARRLWQCLDQETCDKAYLCLIKGMKKTDIRYLYVSALLMEKKMLSEEDGLNNPAEIWEALFNVAQYWVSCAASLYREDVFMGELMGAIPAPYQFGWYILQANAVKEQNSHVFIRKMADAAKAYPAMKELCKKVIREIALK